MRSRYCGPARPRTVYKKWLQSGYKAVSWSRDQANEPLIYAPPNYFDKYFEHIAGDYMDLQANSGLIIDLQLNPQTIIHDLNG